MNVSALKIIFVISKFTWTLSQTVNMVKECYNWFWNRYLKTKSC